MTWIRLSPTGHWVRIAVIFLILSVILYSLHKVLSSGQLSGVSSADLGFSVVLCLLIFFLSGAKLGLATHRMYGCRLDLLDRLSLPMAMNLWGYIIPVKGGMLYSIFYLKEKYRIQIHKGGSISLFVYVTTLSVSGAFLILVMTAAGQFQPFILAIGLVLLFNYQLLRLFFWFIRPANGAAGAGWRRKLQMLILQIERDVGAAFLDRRLLVGLVLMSVLHFLVSVAWYGVSARALGIDLGIMTLILIVTLTHVSLVFRVFPGNLGVTEMLTGMTTFIVEGAFEQGMLLGVFVRAVNLLVTLVVGGGASVAHMLALQLMSLASLRERVRAARETVATPTSDYSDGR